MKKSIFISIFCVASLFANPVFQEEIPINGFKILSADNSSGRKMLFTTEEGNFTLNVSSKDLMNLTNSSLNAKILKTENDDGHISIELIFTEV